MSALPLTPAPSRGLVGVRNPVASLPSQDGGERLKLALYHPWIYLSGGIERSILELLMRSRHDWTVYTHHFDGEATFPELLDQDVREMGKPISVRRSLGPLVRAGARIASSRFPVGGEQGLLVSSEGLGDLAVARARIPAVAYCHTPLKIVHDQVTRSRLEADHPILRQALRVLGPSFSAVDRRMWRRYQHAFANSNETRDRIGQARLADPADVEVLHPGVDTARFTYGDAPREDLFLVAGRIMWQKNIELAIDALREARAQGSTAELVVAGAVDEKSQPYLESLRQRAADLPVRFVVNPSDHELRDLYRRCKALLFTPPNEDWGIVPLEAMACGAPVIAVDAGGPRESVLHEVTGWLVPGHVSAFAATMRSYEAMSPLAVERMRLAARRHATTHDWDRFARRIDDVMEAVVRGRQPAQVQRAMAETSEAVASSQVQATAPVAIGA